ncbi:MAG TPA: hypothetical protein VHV55_21145 [Pirellulales bacterium]|jgi:hypothetical protein|nr:hypothetical protein [Pirellulales bacterium]
MAKKKAAARRSSGTVGIQTVEGDEQIGNHVSAEESSEAGSETTAAESNGKPGKAERKPKAKLEPQTNGSFGVGEIRKAAQFANSTGGLDKALTLLQILKVAKEVQ